MILLFSISRLKTPWPMSSWVWPTIKWWWATLVNHPAWHNKDAHRPTHELRTSLTALSAWTPSLNWEAFEKTSFILGHLLGTTGIKPIPLYSLPKKLCWETAVLGLCNCIGPIKRPHCLGWPMLEVWHCRGNAVWPCHQQCGKVTIPILLLRFHFNWPTSSCWHAFITQVEKDTEPVHNTSSQCQRRTLFWNCG